MTITYSLADIEAAQSGLTTLAGDYRESRDGYDGVRDALGNGDVAKGLDDFTDDWKKKRNKQVGMIEEAAAALATIRETYTTIDEDGVATLQKEGS